MTTQLFVGGFPYETTQEQLAAYFRSCGTVKDVKILLERNTGRSRGLGFVEMSSEAEAKAAMAKLNGSNFGSRKIFVSEARPQEKREEGFRGKPGFVERRSGKDRRQTRGTSAGGEPRREGFRDPKKKWLGKPSFADKPAWMKRPSAGGDEKRREDFRDRKKKWLGKPSFTDKPAWMKRPAAGGDFRRADRPAGDVKRSEDFGDRKKKWLGKPGSVDKPAWKKSPASGGEPKKKKWGAGGPGAGQKWRPKRKKFGMGIVLAALTLLTSSRSFADLNTLDWRSAIKTVTAPASIGAARARPAGVPPSKRLTPILYGSDQARCEDEANFLYDLSTDDVTLAARCHKVPITGELWQWAVDTIGAFSSGVIPGKPSPLRPVAFYDEEGCRRYGSAAARLSASGVILAYACRPVSVPGGRDQLILDVSLTLSL